MVAQEVAPHEKRELAQARRAHGSRQFFSPYTDIHETERAVVVSMEMPASTRTRSTFTSTKAC